MANVNCRYCKKQFNRDKEPFIQIPVGTTGKSFRYAHADCYLKEFNEGKVKEKYKVWNPQTASTCFWCNKALDTTDENVIAMPQLPNRWVHKGCAQIHPENDLEELAIYIIKLFKVKDNFIPPSLKKQLNQYEQDYEFTYSGMKKALRYWYEIKGHPIDTTRGVGIIPLVYREARDYYYSLYVSQLANAQIEDYSKYIPQDIEIQITPPKRQIEKRKLFTFLDEEITNGK